MSITGLKEVSGDQSDLREEIVSLLSLLIPKQIELGAKAVETDEHALAHLMACQLFDTLDWSRVNLDPKTMDLLGKKLLSQPVNNQFNFKSLEQLEEYAEEHFAC